MTAALLPALADPPDRVALRFGRGADLVELSYRELAAAAGALAGPLGGLFPGGRARHADRAHRGRGGRRAAGRDAPRCRSTRSWGPRELQHVLTDSAPELVLAAPGVELPGAFAGIERVDVALRAA